MKTIIIGITVGLLSLINASLAHAQWAVVDGTNLIQNIKEYVVQGEQYATMLNTYENQLLMYQNLERQATLRTITLVIPDQRAINGTMDDNETALQSGDSNSIASNNAQASSSIHTNLSTAQDALSTALVDSKSADGQDSELQAQNEMMAANGQLQQIVAQEIVAESDYQAAARKSDQDMQQQAASNFVNANSSTSTTPIGPSAAEQICGSSFSNQYCSNTIQGVSGTISGGLSTN
jgi:conjugal transfer/entry exclusion protein